MSGRLLDKAMGRIVKRGRLTLIHADGRTCTLGEAEAGFPEVTVRLADKGVARDILLDPRLGAAETFMDGRLIIEEGEIMDLVSLLRHNAPWDEGRDIGKPSLRRRLRNRLAFARESFNRRIAARRNVAHHYDIGNDFYRLMLDAEHMQYSCAYWPRDGMSLAEAQEAKLAHIASKLALESGHRVLDIGCGWGGMAIYLAQNFNVQVTAITLSTEQLALAKQRAEEAGVRESIEFRLADYRELPGEVEPFDRIVSVGMFEHVGRPQFGTFFRTCSRLLRPEGVMLLHTIGRMGPPGSTDAFTRKYIFPGGYIPALSETVAASEPYRLIASDVETLRLHYAFTLREWYRRCQENREAIVEMFDERFYRMWTFYLSGATAAFEYGGMCNYQIQFCRDRRVLPLSRGYMEEAESRLLGQ